MKDTEKIVTALHLAPQLNIDKMTNEIFVIRQQTINYAIMKQLQELMHEKGITELYAIDENKVMQLIKEHNALEIIRRLPSDYVCDLLGVFRSFKDYTFGDFISWGGDETPILINEEEYDLLKGVLYEKEN